MSANPKVVIVGSAVATDGKYYPICKKEKHPHVNADHVTETCWIKIDNRIQPNTKKITFKLHDDVPEDYQFSETPSPISLQLGGNWTFIPHCPSGSAPADWCLKQFDKEARSFVLKPPEGFN